MQISSLPQMLLLLFENVLNDWHTLKGRETKEHGDDANQMTTVHKFLGSFRCISFVSF